MFQLTAARRRLDECASPPNYANMFQLTAARRRLVLVVWAGIELISFQLTAARRRLGFVSHFAVQVAACFNSQPPEGGWAAFRGHRCHVPRFNSQPPEGGWSRESSKFVRVYEFQLTAARRRLVAQTLTKTRN